MYAKLQFKSDIYNLLSRTSHSDRAVVLSWNAVYHHFRKWSRLGEWQTMFAALVRKYKDRLDMSVTHIDGSHTSVPIAVMENRLRIICSMITL